MAPNQDCGSSSVLLRDFRQETANPRTCTVCEVNSTSTPDRSFHSQSYLMSPRSQVLMESVCILNKVNIYSLLFVKYLLRRTENLNVVSKRVNHTFDCSSLAFNCWSNMLSILSHNDRTFVDCQILSPVRTHKQICTLKTHMKSSGQDFNCGSAMHPYVKFYIQVWGAKRNL